MAPRYRVTLTKEERKELEGISTKGKKGSPYRIICSSIDPA